jgi:hypothetical protein
MVLAAGDRFGRYHILGEIRGVGMGAVWRVHDTLLGQDVALEILDVGRETSAGPSRPCSGMRAARLPPCTTPMP